jgi:hypothetical protein
MVMINIIKSKFVKSGQAFIPYFQLLKLTKNSV